MTEDVMPAMPAHYKAIQVAHARLMDQVRMLIAGTAGLTPQLALTVAFIGDQIVSPSDLRRYGYVVGTNATYYIGQLKREGLIEDADRPDGRQRPIKLTDHGRRIAAKVRKRLAYVPSMQHFADETAA